MNAFRLLQILALVWAAIALYSGGLSLFLGIIGVVGTAAGGSMGPGAGGTIRRLLIQGVILLLSADAALSFALDSRSHVLRNVLEGAVALLILFAGYIGTWLVLQLLRHVGVSFAWWPRYRIP